MFIAVTLYTGELTLINLNEIEQIRFAQTGSGEEAAIFLKSDLDVPIRLADTMKSIVKGLASAGQIIKPFD